MGSDVPAACRLLVIALVLLANASHAGSLVAEQVRLPVALEGGQLKGLLSERENLPVILNFWASWCQPCRDEMPSLQRLAERHRSKGLSVLTIAVADSPERAAQFMWDTGVVLPLLDDSDRSLSRSLGVKTLPMTLVLDRGHRIAARGRGAIDWDAAAIDKRLLELLR